MLQSMSCGNGDTVSCEYDALERTKKIYYNNNNNPTLTYGYVVNGTLGPLKQLPLRLHMIVFSAAHAEQIEPFFASLANPTLKSRDSIMYPAVIMILRFAGLLMPTPLPPPARAFSEPICSRIVVTARLTSAISAEQK